MRRALSARAQWLLPLLLVAFLAFSYLRLRVLSPPAAETSQSGAARARVTSLAGEVMGTTYSAKLVLPSGVSQEAASTKLREALDGVDRAMSTYRKDSELSRWNEAGPGKAVEISPQLREVVEVALQVGRESRGALDITLAPVIDAWGFGPSQPEPPSAAELEALRAKIGLDKLQLTDAGLLKRVAGVRCDLSSVAKGYAVDQAAAALRSLGVKRFLVEVGGELIAQGHKPDASAWRVAIERPTPGMREVQLALPLTDLGLATSGDYRNYYERDGKRLSHLIDARTERPIEHALASVSVFHARVAVADAWATALTVLGPEVGPQLAEQHGLMAFFIVRDGKSGFRTIQSSAFRERFHQQ